MAKSKQNVLDVDLSYLACTLYTLVNYHKVFKKLTLEKNIKSFKEAENCFSTDLDSDNEFYNLLNKNSLRRFSYLLIRPIINSDFISGSYIRENGDIKKDFYNEISLLLIYLKKFNSTYRRFFLYKKGFLNPSISKKEINFTAIKILFFLAGI